MRKTLALMLCLFAAPALSAEPTYYAEIDATGTVLRVIVADSAFIAKQSGTWVQTFMDGSARKNYAGVGYRHDKTMDAFVAPQPFPSWKLNSASAQWEAPVKVPQGMKMPVWDEKSKQWVDSKLGG